MADRQDGTRTSEVLDLQERYLSDQIKHQHEIIEGLRRKRRRQVAKRSFSLFVGLVLVAYGAIEIALMQSLADQLGTILLVGAAEVAGIPLAVYGFVLFQKLAFDADLSHAAERLVDLQDDLSQVREERKNLAESPETTLETTAADPHDDGKPTASQNLATRTSTPVCPECGKEFPEGGKICRNCGHLFV